MTKRIILLTLLCLLCLLSISAIAPMPQAEIVPGCFAVRAQAGQAIAAGESLGLNWYRVQGDSQAKVEQTYKGAFVEPCYVVRTPLPQPGAETEDAGPQAGVNDPLVGQMWGLGRIAALEAWDVTQGQGKVVVIVFDTGADASHPDLAGKPYGGKSFVNTPGDWRDGNGHGTHVAGTIAAATNNGVGVAGVGYRLRFSVAQVLNAQGSGDTSRIAQAMIEATNAVPDGWKAVFNFSLGCECPPPQILVDATNYAASRDIVLVAALGNNNADTRARRFYPAALEQFISVSATDVNDSKATFSNWGDPDISAPGVNILSTYPGNQYKPLSGTSMASPHVAGAAALVRTAHPTWTAAEVRQALLATARKPPGYTPLWHGAGIVDVGSAVRYNGGVVPVPTRYRPTETPPPSNNWGLEVERLINVERTARNLTALRHDDRLARAADWHNRWMDANACFAHNCPGEPDVWQRIRNQGYPLVSGGENIGNGYQNPPNMVEGWMGSSGHRAAILNTYWPDIGCAFLDGAGGNYMGLWWTCNFARGGTGSQDGPVDMYLPGPLQWMPGIK